MDIKKEQDYIYNLCQEHILSLKGQVVREDGMVAEYIDKQDLFQAVAEMLTAYGEETTRFLESTGGKNEADSKENN